MMNIKTLGTLGLLIALPQAGHAQFLPCNPNSPMGAVGCAGQVLQQIAPPRPAAPPQAAPPVAAPAPATPQPSTPVQAQSPARAPQPAAAQAQASVGSVPTGRMFAISSTAMAITGDIVLETNRLTFANSKYIDIQLQETIADFSSSTSGKVRVHLFKVINPNDPPLQRGNRICDGRMIRYVAIYREPPTAYSPKPSISLEFFSNSNPPRSSEGMCGSFNYEPDAQPPARIAANAPPTTPQPQAAASMGALSGKWQVPPEDRKNCGIVDMEEIEIRQNKMSYGMPPWDCVLSNQAQEANGALRLTYSCKTDSQCVGGGCPRSQQRRETLLYQNGKIVFQRQTYVKNACP